MAWTILMVLGAAGVIIWLADTLPHTQLWKRIAKWNSGRPGDE